MADRLSVVGKLHIARVSEACPDPGALCRALFPPVAAVLLAQCNQFGIFGRYIPFYAVPGRIFFSTFCFPIFLFVFSFLFPKQFPCNSRRVAAAFQVSCIMSLSLAFTWPGMRTMDKLLGSLCRWGCLLTWDAPVSEVELSAVQPRKGVRPAATAPSSADGDEARSRREPLVDSTPDERK